MFSYSQCTSISKIVVNERDYEFDLRHFPNHCDHREGLRVRRVVVTSSLDPVLPPSSERLLLDSTLALCESETGSEASRSTSVEFDSAVVRRGSRRVRRRFCVRFRGGP